VDTTKTFQRRRRRRRGRKEKGRGNKKEKKKRMSRRNGERDERNKNCFSNFILFSSHFPNMFGVLASLYNIKPKCSDSVVFSKNNLKNDL
jgi:hypothetical protein